MGRKQERHKCNQERKESFGQRKKARTRQDKCNQRKKRDFWTGEESKNETSSGARRRLFQQQKHTYFMELEIVQYRRDSLEEIQPKPELRRSLLKEGRTPAQAAHTSERETESKRRRTLPIRKHIGRKLFKADRDTAENTTDSGNSHENTGWNILNAETAVKHIGWNILNALRKTRDYRVHQSSFAITLEATVPRTRWVVQFACRILKTLGELKEPWTPQFNFFQPSFTTSLHDSVPFPL